ncbi:hypothetical protein Hdeb2414_s0024g00652561 [Helianthus debilis subsp. tardiflorus]
MMKTSKCVNIVSIFLWSSLRRLQVNRFELLLQLLCPVRCQSGRFQVWLGGSFKGGGRRQTQLE